MNKRHTCVICGKKRNEHRMKNIFGNAWVCGVNDSYFSRITCADHSDIFLSIKILNDLKKLKKIRITHIAAAMSVQDGQSLEINK